MKIIILLLSVLIFSCNNEDQVLKNTQELIKSEKKRLYDDSVAYDHKMQIELARKRLEKATGKKDTLTDEEWLKKAEEEFKQQP